MSGHGVPAVLRTAAPPDPDDAPVVTRASLYIEGMHIYLHVPFCTRKCSYCDFAIAVRRQVPSDAYVSAILREWAMWQTDPVWDESPEVDTIYLGGGTPSRVSPDAIAQLLKRIANDRPVAADAEITLEANPDDVTLAAAREWRAAGVNRVSLGVQSFDPDVLRWMHRTHTADQVPRAVEALRDAGIEELSVDLIFGLPPELRRDWSRDLASVFDLEPRHLSLYGLTVEGHTPVGRWTLQGKVSGVDEDSYAAEFLAAHDALVGRGYEHYEVSNAALPGHRARHNAAYWRRAPFIGLGPSAHSGFRCERRWNIREWAAYERAMVAGNSPVEGRELLDADAVALEELYLGLRTAEGITRDRLPPARTQEWQLNGWAGATADRLRLTPEGWLRLDGLVASIKS